MPAADSLARMMERPIAHRGLHGCGASGPVENTIPAALAAVEAGYGIECDVLFASDGTPVVVHDATLTRLAGVPDAVADLDMATLGAITLKGGDTVPTLEALLAAIAGRVTLVIEIKSGIDPSMADAVLDRVDRYTGPVVLESFDAAIVDRCRHAPCPIGLVGPSDNEVDLANLSRCECLSWNVARLEAVSILMPTSISPPTTMPLTTWTVRSASDAALAVAAGAQIVFEGWRP